MIVRIPTKKTINILICILALFIVYPKTATAGHAVETGKNEGCDPKRLEGRWVRHDGGYVLELRDIKNDGTLKAAYFNPKPITVARVKLENKKGRISIFVELRDVNYPGSIYNLQYDPKTDSLRGTYYQAVERQTFSIEFVRIKNQ